MRRRRAFNPQVWDVLEDRVVPSLAAVAPPPILLGQTVALPPQVQHSSQVHAAFDAFAKSYLAAIDSVLLAPDRSGVVDPAANRPAFDAAVKQALETLAQRVVASLDAQSPGSALSTQIVDAILGEGADSLESQLMALSTAAIEGTASETQSLAADATQTMQQAATRVAAMIDAPVSPAVAQGVVAAFTSDPVESPDAKAAAEVASQALSRTREAFGAFLSDYFRAVRDVLLASGSNATTDTAAAREEFDARVDASLQVLTDTVSRDLESVSSSRPSRPASARRSTGPARTRSKDGWRACRPRTAWKPRRSAPSRSRRSAP